MSLRSKLIVAIGFPLAIVYAVMLWTVTDVLGSRTRSRLEETGARAITERAALLGAAFERVAGAGRVAAAVLGSKAAVSPEQVVAALEALKSVEPAVINARLLAGSPPGKEWRGPLPTERGSGPTGCTLSLPVRLVTTTGTLSIDVDPREVLRAVAPRDETQGAWLVIDGQGDPIGWGAPPGAAGRMPPRLSDLGGRADIASIARRALAGETGVARAEGLMLPGARWFYFAPIPTTGWSLIATLPESMVLAFARTQLQVGLGVLLGGLVVIIAIVWIMASRITRPLARLAAAVVTLGTGNLEARVTGVETGDEIEELAGAFNRTTADLRRHVDALTHETAAREAVESELRVARQMQEALLPRSFPQGVEFELHGVNIPARQVAGDFYDAFVRPDGRLAFLIADVSGKGAAAALYMAVARTLLRQALAGTAPLSEALQHVNDALEQDNPGSMYVTVFAGHFDPRTGDMSYVNAGHLFPLLLRPEGQVEELTGPRGTMLGMLPGARFVEATGCLDPGHRLVLYTDGVPEAAAPDGTFYGDERARALLGQCSGDDLQGLCRRVTQALDSWQQGDPHDDVTLLVLGRRRA